MIDELFHVERQDYFWMESHSCDILCHLENVLEKSLQKYIILRCKNIWFTKQNSKVSTLLSIWKLVPEKIVLIEFHFFFILMGRNYLRIHDRLKLSKSSND